MIPLRNCPKCGEAKDSSEFKRGSRSHCATCRKHRRDTYHKRWAAANREKLNECVRKYRAKRYKEEGRWVDNGPKSAALKSWMLELKALPCTDCGDCFPACCMDFDHKPGTNKAYNIGSMFAHHYSRELIEAELVKCELVCANCHRIRTRDRRTGSGGKK